MYRFRASVLLIILVFFSCNSPSNKPALAFANLAESKIVPTPPISESEIHTLDSLLTRTLKKNKFNGNVLVAIKGYPIFEYSDGFSDLFTKDSLNLNTVFQLASVSKGFTAMSVLILKERGLLDLNDSVQRYIPEFPFNNVTIKQLLQHTAGLQNYMYFVDQQWDDEKPITNEDVLDLINANNPQLNFRPGSRHDYSNTGYAILALLVERVSGFCFHAFVQREIFLPLGMNHTFAWNSATMDTVSNIATGFTRKGWRYRKINHDPLDEVVGDKSIYSTIGDLLRWDQALYTDVLISDTLLKEAFSKAISYRGRSYNYGYGWRIKENGEKKIIYHNGLWNGFTSSLSRYVDENITIILLNNTNAPAASIVRQLYSVLNTNIPENENEAESD